VLLIQASAVHEALDIAVLMDALEEAHRGLMPEHGWQVLEQPDATGRRVLLSLPAWLAEDGLGVKLVTSFPGNREQHGLPTVHSIYVWFDPATGEPAALMDGQALIFRKTAADSALGSRFLSRPESERLLMVGAGALAPYLIRAHQVARPGLREIGVWNRTRDAAQTLVNDLVAEGFGAHVVDDLDDALESADIVSAATMSGEPLIKGDLLRPGTHVDLVGSFTPLMREGDDALLRRAEVFVDSRTATEHSGDFVDPVSRGVYSTDQIAGDLAALARGTAGRSGPDAVTMMKNGGGSHLDYFTAREVLRAVENGRVVHGVHRFCLTGSPPQGENC
jgi:ornithine cyclodeaminase